MPSVQRGAVVKRGNRWAARWYDESGGRRFQGGFETKSVAREWVDPVRASVGRLLRRGRRRSAGVGHGSSRIPERPQCRAKPSLIPDRWNLPTSLRPL